MLSTAALCISRSATLLQHAAAAQTLSALAPGRSLHGFPDSACGYIARQQESRPQVHATTILCVRKNGQVFLIGDGQVSVGNTIIKHNVRKIRRIGETVVAGFAGSAADGLSLLERLETKLEEHPGQLLRASVELAKQWRQDKALRFLQAELLVADASTILTVSGNGDVLEPHDGVMAIGSGGMFATAAARALMDVDNLDASTIGKKAMRIASDMCVFTNSNFVWELLSDGGIQSGSSAAEAAATAAVATPSPGAPLGTPPIAS